MVMVELSSSLENFSLPKPLQFHSHTTAAAGACVLTCCLGAGDLHNGHRTERLQGWNSQDTCSGSRARPCHGAIVATTARSLHYRIAQGRVVLDCHWLISGISARCSTQQLLAPPPVKAAVRMHDNISDLCVQGASCAAQTFNAPSSCRMVLLPHADP
jgi:hypothetical protein